MDKIAVVILNWNGQALLQQFLPSVVANTSPDVSIVVADNASTDDSVEFVKNTYPQLKVIEMGENFGYAKGYNQALRKVEAEYYLLLNSDVEVTPNWLKPLVHYLDSHKDVAVVQPKIVSQRQNTHFEYAGASGGYIDKLGFPFCRGRIFDEVEVDSGQYDTVVDVFWASGACMLIKTKEFIEAGGFDEQFFAHMEEIDLCWRLKTKGKRIVCVPQSTIYHVGGATLGEDSPHKVYLNFRNNMLMLYKNLESKQLNKVLRKRKMYNLIAALNFLFCGEIGKTKAILKAHRDFATMCKSYEIIRQEKENAISFNSDGMYKGNIVVDFYLRKKKKFSQLQF